MAFPRTRQRPIARCRWYILHSQNEGGPTRRARQSFCVRVRAWSPSLCPWAPTSHRDRERPMIIRPSIEWNRPKKIGATGFEPATSWSQTMRSSQAELRPVGKTLFPSYHFVRRNESLNRVAAGDRRELQSPAGNNVKEGIYVTRGHDDGFINLSAAPQRVARNHRWTRTSGRSALGPCRERESPPARPDACATLLPSC